MTPFLYQISGLPGYRWASGVLIAALLLVPVLLVRLGVLDWVATVLSFPIFIALVVLTSRRLRNAGLSGWWIVLMIFAMNFGPEWDGPPPLKLHVSHLLHLIPVALGCFVQRAQGNRETP